MSKEDKNKDEQGFSGDENNEGFLGTPENYFESFGARLFGKIKADEELKEYPLLHALQKTNPFAVPEGYFETREELLQYPLLFELKKNNFSVPAFYFESLPAVVANKIELFEETKAYETLASLDKANGFVVPENYFEEFAAEVKQLVNPTKVVPLYSRVLKQYKFAVAAAVLLLVTLTIVLLNNNTKVAPDTDCGTLACLSKKEIINSGIMQNISEETIIEMVDIKALSDSLSLKKNGKTDNVSLEEVSDNVDVNTLTEEL